MTDVEERLRAVLAADAEGAPEIPPAVLAGRARGEADRLRRRRSATVAAALAVAATAAGVLVAVGLRTTTTVQEGPSAGTSGPTSGPPSVTSAGGEGVLRYRNVEVPVPAAWLAPDAVRCGTPVADAAYVVRAGAAVRSCLATPEHPERLTTVVLQSWDLPVADGDPPPPATGERVLDDGRTQVVTRFPGPGPGVRVVVTSPDAGLARRLLAGARAVAPPSGCPEVATEEDLPPGPDVSRDGLVERTVTSATVCSYTDGLLDSASRLDAERTADLVSALEVLPAGLGRPAAWCSTARSRGAAAEDHWLVVLDPQPVEGLRRALWVAAGPCVEAGVRSPTGATGRLTSPLVSLLWAAAPGPQVEGGVVGGKG